MANVHSSRDVIIRTQSWPEAVRFYGPVFEYLVPDVEATRDLLVRAGCPVVEEDPAVPKCYVRDPYGMTFNVGRKP